MLAVMLAVSVYLAFRIKNELNYQWNWSVIPQYLFRFDETRQTWVANLLMEGLFTTIRLSVWATILGMILGAVMGLFRTSHSLFRRMIGRSYVEAVRNLPPLVLIFLFYFFVSDQIMPIFGVDEFIRSRTEGVQNILGVLFAPPARFTAFLSATLTLALYEGAYITEIIRAGILSVEKGQWEASYALGFSRWQQMRHVILPQALQRVLPPLAGQFISTIKDSAIVSVISIQELTYQGHQLVAATYLTFEVWITVTLLYLILTLGCSLAVRRLELYWARNRA